MSNLSSNIIFEYPLNERMRIWLRIEYLLHHLFAYTTIPEIQRLLFLLHNISGLLDILERSDSRGELLKELERQQQKLSLWINTPGVDMARLEKLQQHLKTCAAELLASPRIQQSLREDLLLSAVRQRLISPGCGYPFDLPILQLWLHQKPEIQHEQVTGWLAAIDPLQRALKLYLSLLRQAVPFRQQQATQGFYRDKTAEGDLLRLQLTRQQNLFPQISAHKHHFAVHFLAYDQSPEKIPAQLSFGLACC